MYLAEELTRLGHEVHVLHSIDAYKTKRRRTPSPTESEISSVHQIETPLSLSAYSAYVLGTSPTVTRRFSGLVKEIRPDVVHHHNVSLLGYNILKRYGRYLNLYTMQDLWLVSQETTPLVNGPRARQRTSSILQSLAYKRPPQFWRYRPQFEKAIRDLDIIISPTNCLKRMISSRLPVKQVVIPNFVPHPPYPIQPSGFGKFFLFVGMLERHKGPLRLIEAFEQLGSRCDSKLIMLGSGSLKRRIYGEIKKHHLVDKVLQYDWAHLGVIYRLLNDANALIISSIWPENCPLISLQALSVGTTVIASNYGGLPEILGKIDRNLLFHSVAELVDILADFKPRSRSFLKQVYEDNYSPYAFMKQYTALVKAVGRPATTAHA
jgi:glycosyltransferase involved in cell wall biosynthesis